MRILVTNDDGIDALGLRALCAALIDLDDIAVDVVAPDRDRTAAARSFAAGRPLTLERRELESVDGCLVTDGTPVDCVRLGVLGALGPRPDLVISGINHGVNLGDDIGYSGTVAAAWEAAIHGLPAIAVSQQSRWRELDFNSAREWSEAEFAGAARLAVALVERVRRTPLPAGTLLNVNHPHAVAARVEACALGHRIYRGSLELLPAAAGEAQRGVIAGELDYERAEGIDFAALAGGAATVTLLRLRAAEPDAMPELRELRLEELGGDGPTGSVDRALAAARELTG